MAGSFYGGLFSSEPFNADAILEAIRPKITDDMNDDLIKPYTDEEIKKALF
jgi:hypothetical protein